MWNWFAAGGAGMFLVLAIGVGGIGYGAKTLRDPSRERVAVLRGIPGLIVTSALFFFGLNVWAVNRALESDGFAKAHGLAASDMPVVGLVGFCEATQVLTLGGLLAAVAGGLLLVANARSARSERA
jgi:hypothetical protein